MYNVSVKKNKLVKSQKQSSVKIVCIDCRYNFSLRMNSNIKPMCPYCGGSRLMKNENTAQKLIDDSLFDDGYYRRQTSNHNK